MIYYYELMYILQFTEGFLRILQHEIGGIASEPWVNSGTISLQRGNMPRKSPYLIMLTETEKTNLERMAQRI
jgi:hypothetical protein